MANARQAIRRRHFPDVLLHTHEGKERVGRDIFMYSITLDPERDSVAALARYARAHNAGPGWLFLRTEAATTELLRRKLGFYDRDPAADARKETHVAFLRYGNEPRMQWSSTSALLDPKVNAKLILALA